MLAINPATVRAHLFEARRTLRGRLLQALPAAAQEDSCSRPATPRRGCCT
jgi:hypothetical protein